MRFIRSALALCLLLCAPLLLMQGLAYSRTLPGPLSWNGFWQAELARLSVGVEQTEAGLAIQASDVSVELALDAFAREPLASDSLFVLAVAQRGEIDALSARSAIDAAIALDKRNRHVGGLQLEAAAFSGDIPAMLSVIDRLSLSHPQFTSDFMQLFAVALQEPGGEQLVADALSESPPWSESFWASIPITEGNVARLVQLRMNAPQGTSAESDARLVQGFVEAGMLAEAFQLWEMASGSSANETGFIDTEDFAPIGWQVSRNSDFNFSARGNGRFAMYVKGRADGELARQLLRLTPGIYSFSADLAADGSAEDFTIGLQCAERQNALLQEQSITTDAQWEVGRGCSYHWLIIRGDAYDSRRPLSATIFDMAFEPQG